MAKLIYTVVYEPTWWECMITIDFSYVFKNAKPGIDWSMEQAMLNMITYWSNGENRLKLNGGDITKTFLQQLAREINLIQARGRKDVVSALAGLEGWWPMDGSRGIEILEIDNFDFHHNEYEVLLGTKGKRSRGHEKD